jgi:chromosome segregation protein
MPQLKPGQRLVSREGDVWRWDGFVAAAEAPSAAAKRLAERNRLVSLDAEMKEAQAAADAARAEHEEARAAVETGVKSERERREAWRAATSALDVARRALQMHERKLAEQTAQTSALDEAHRRTEAQRAEVTGGLEAVRAEFAGLPAIDGLQADAATLRDVLNRERTTYGEARARHDGLEREARLRSDRLKAIAQETDQWRARAAKAREQVETLSARLAETEAGLAEMAAMPQQLADRRFKLMNMLSEAERDRKAAADALQEAENAVREADRALREAQELAATSREDHARLGARLEASKQRQDHCQARIAETLNCPPPRCFPPPGWKPKNCRLLKRSSASCCRCATTANASGPSTCAPTRKPPPSPNSSTR